VPQQFLQGSSKMASGLARMGGDGSPQDLCQVMIETAGIRTERVWSFVEANQGQLGKEIRLISAVTATLPRTVLAELTGFAPVVKIWENTPVKVLAEEKAFPVYGGIMNGEYQVAGKGVTVAVLDTGIAPHEDLTEPENRILAWNDLVGARTGPYDDHGHGTHVAGLIAGNGRASRGRYKGVAPAARLAGIKVLDQNGCGWLADLLSGLEWCLDNRKTLRIRIINLSVGTRSQSNYILDPLCRTVAAAWRNGIVVCAAAGKVGAEYCNTNSPGGINRVITVGNLDYQKTLTWEDERLQWSRVAEDNHDFVIPDLVAPGSNVVAIKRDGGYCTYGGSSTATPLVAGGVALLLERWPGLQPDQVKRLLKQNAENCGLGERLQGAGLLNLDRVFGIRRQQSFAGSNSQDQLAPLILKTVLNLFNKKNAQTVVQMKEILATILPLFNQLLTEKKGDLKSKSNTVGTDVIK
jgi:serine protease AprX